MRAFCRLLPALLLAILPLVARARRGNGDGAATAARGRDESGCGGAERAGRFLLSNRHVAGRDDGGSLSASTGRLVCDSSAGG